MKFTFEQSGETWLRIPISYALKLALADLSGTQPHMPEKMRLEAKRLLRHFSNDNTSPETTSFHVVGPREQVLIGEAVARESARRFLFTSLLMSWANLRFGLLESGQRALVYHAPHPPVTADRAVVVHFGLVLPRTVHEPVPVGLGRRRGQVATTCTCATRCSAAAS